MTILPAPIPPVQQPMTDPRTGKLTADWEAYFSKLGEWSRAVTTIIEGL